MHFTKTRPGTTLTINASHNVTLPQAQPLRPLRRQLMLAAMVASAPLIAGTSWAQSFPSKPITIIVPTAAGGGNDAIVRTIAQKMGQVLGQPVIVDNRPGANGAIAAEAAARAQPDGHTLMLGYIATHALNPALQKLRYDPVKSFEAIGLIGYSPTVLVTTPGLPVKNASELVQLLKAQPDKLAYASAGNGTAPHLAAEMFKMSTKTVMLHVRYKGSAPAITDTLGGTTQLMFPSFFSAYPHIKSGRLKAIGIAGQKRAGQMKDLPTLKEQGIANVDISQWYGLFAPAKTSKPLVDQLNKALNVALNDPAIVTKLEEQGLDVEASSPEAFASYVNAELLRWRQVIQQTGITAD